MTGRPDWHALAACRGTGPALFFPDDHGPDAYAPARSLCAGCPVIAECDAVGAHEHHGMWAGRTPAERRKMRRRIA